MKNDKEKVIIWMQRDALGPLNPAIQAYPGAPILFIYDPAWMDEEKPSMKRIQFIDECVAETGAKMVHADPARYFLDEFRANGISRIVTTGTPCRHSRAAIVELGKSIFVDVLPLPRLVDDTGPFDLRSFSRYWSRASRSAFGAG